MPKIGVFVDTNDQFFHIKYKWGNRKLDYKAYYNKATAYGDVTRAIAYGTQIDDNSSKFISCLHYLGFEPNFKSIATGGRFNRYVAMTVDILRLIEHLDIVIIGISSLEMLPLLNYLKELPIKTIILSCRADRELKLASDEWVEVDESMLEAKISISKTL